MKKRVLVLSYSQSGQLNRVVDSILGPLKNLDQVELVVHTIEPVEPFPFPWPFLEFFNTFPETVYEEPIALKPLSIAKDERFDLIILAYQVWFLSPSLPVSSFLNSTQARRLFANTPVITVIGCRNMWLMAQEKVKQKLAELGANLIDNVVLTDSAHSALTFVSTPLWVLTGNKGPYLGGVIPVAGIPEAEIQGAARFGDAVARQLPGMSRPAQSMLGGLGAVKVNERLIASEKIAHRSFRIWGKLLRSIGDPASRPRKIVLILYIVFLITLILTVVPISAVLKRLLAPLAAKRTARQKSYYAAPSGEATYRMN